MAGRLHFKRQRSNPQPTGTGALQRALNRLQVGRLGTTLLCERRAKSGKERNFESIEHAKLKIVIFFTIYITYFLRFKYSKEYLKFLLIIVF